MIELYRIISYIITLGLAESLRRHILAVLVMIHIKVSLYLGVMTQDELSVYLEALIERHPDTRSSFRIKQLRNTGKITFQHSHAKSATVRNAATATLDQALRNAGYTTYSVSMGAADQRNQIGGCRAFYWGKDLSAKYQNDPITDKTGFMMIDVDYYLDLSEWMSHFKPIVMYTLVPNKTSFSCSEFSYVVRPEGVEYFVTGGARYKHQLWDYNCDCMYVDTEDEYRLFFNVESIVVDPEGLNDGHRFVMLTPMARVPLFLSEIMELKAQPLRRINFALVSGASQIVDPIGRTISLLPPNGLTSVDVDLNVYEAIVQRVLAKKTPFTIGDIESFMIKPGSSVHEAAAVLYQILTLLGLNKVKYNYIIPTAAAIISYAPMGPLRCSDYKDRGQIITNPIITPSHVIPVSGLNTELAAIVGRVTKVKNDVTPTRDFTIWSREFAEHLVPEAGIGTPFSLEDVMAIQNRPSQKARTALSLHKIGSYAINKLKTFNKLEAYANVNSPRIITTCSTELTVELSRYTYAFKNSHLKKMPWYGPGKSPKKTVKRIKSLASKGFVATDFSRFDGSISEWLQKNVNYACYLRWAGVDHSPALKHLLDQVFLRTAITASGHRYDPGVGTRSGSPITTDGNTMINAFVSYCASRHRGLSSTDAWASLGLYSGDDGLNVNEDGFSTALEAVCRSLGLTIDVQTTKPDEPVTYLSRIFVRPLTKPDSFQDPTRTLGKLHLSANTQVSRIQAAFNKCSGYLTTDKLTPLVSDYCVKVVELTGLTEVKNQTSNENYKMSEAWPQNDKDLIRDVFKKVMRITEDELVAKENAIRASDSLDSFPVLFEFDNLEVKIAAIIGDSLVLPGHSWVSTQLVNLPLTIPCQPMKNNSNNPTISGQHSANTLSTTSSRTSPPKPKTTTRKHAVSKSTSQNPTGQPCKKPLSRPTKPSVRAGSTGNRPDVTCRHCGEKVQSILRHLARVHPRTGPSTSGDCATVVPPSSTGQIIPSA